MNINSNISNNKYNKKARISSSDNYKEQHTEYVNLILDNSSDVLISEKENEPERNIDLEIEQINMLSISLCQNFPLYILFF